MQDFNEGEPQAPPQRRFGCLGWLLVIAAGCLLLCGLMCGGVYYAIFHSSLPLSTLEKMLEADGNIEIEGLTGSVSSGFHVDSLRTRGEQDRWSTFEDINFQFNGLPAAFQERRVIIQEFSVGGGEVYLDEFPQFERSDSASEGFDIPEDEPDDAVAGAEEFEGPKEIRIDRLQLSNLKFIETTTDAIFTIDEIALLDFQYLDGRVTRLGDVIVTTDKIEFHSDKSELFADQPSSVVTPKFSGVVRSTIHENIIADISFDADVCFPEDGDLLASASLFDGKAMYNAGREGRIKMVWQDFTLTDYIQWKHGPLPSHVSARMTQVSHPSEDGRIALTIEPGATFQLGELVFEVETRELEGDENADRQPPILAKHSSKAGEFDCRLHWLKDRPYFAVELDSSDQRNTPNLYARVFFGKDLESLSDSEKESVAKLVKTAEETIKPAESTKPVEVTKLHSR